MLAALARLKASIEIVAVDDGSSDGSAGILARHRRRGRRLRLIRHARNLGKGRAVRTALALARGRLVVLQDADLETDPRDLAGLLDAARRHPDCAVFGTRFHSRSRSRVPLATAAANALITGFANTLFGSRLSDIACAYKMLPRDLMLSLGLRAKGFEIEAEITAGLLRRGTDIVEVPVRYRPRRYSEGKKIHPLDGLRILLTLLKSKLGY